MVPSTFVPSADGSPPISASSVVLTTGTFLSGALFVGQTTSPGGRMGDAPSSAGMSHTLRDRLGLRMGRLRTGTPPRIVKDSVDFSQADVKLPDSRPTPFSFLNSHTHCKVQVLHTQILHTQLLPVAHTRKKTQTLTKNICPISHQNI